MSSEATAHFATMARPNTFNELLSLIPTINMGIHIIGFIQHNPTLLVLRIMGQTPIFDEDSLINPIMAKPDPLDTLQPSCQLHSIILIMNQLQLTATTTTATLSVLGFLSHR